MTSPTTLAIINQKGGVGKTTTVINLAASLSIMGQNNLVIDLDPQGNATTGLGKNNNDEDKNVYNLLIKKINIENIIFIYLPYRILLCKSCALCHPFSNLGPPK